MSEDVARLHQPAREVSAEALARAEEMIEREEGVHNRFRGWLAAFVTAVAVGTSLFHLYTAYAIVRPEHLRAIHVAFVLLLTFLIFPVARRFRHHPRFIKQFVALQNADRIPTRGAEAKADAGSVLAFAALSRILHGVYPNL